MDKPIIRWGVLWDSKSHVIGIREYLICRNRIPVLFVTRRETREWIDKKYGYIRTRPDLRREPHGWRMPRPVRVKIARMK